MSKLGTQHKGGNRLGDIVALLKRPGGATSADIELALGLRPVSARALVTRLRRTATVTTTRSGKGPTVYRIET